MLPEFRAATPEFMNYLDGSALVERRSRLPGFKLKKLGTIRARDFPEIFLNDGPEHSGYIGCKCSSPKIRTARLGLFDAKIL